MTNASSPADDVAPRIWIDVEDLFEFAAGQSRPSGIQRLVFELCTALAAPGPGSPVSFVRHDAASGSFRVVAWSAVQALYGRMTRDPATPPQPVGRPPGVVRAGPPQRLRTLAFRLPPELRLPLTRFYVQQREALEALGELGRAAVRTRARAVAAEAAHADAAGMGQLSFAERVRPGDVVLAPGAHWYHPDYAALIEKARRDHGIRFALLVYDVIPLRRPEWCEPGLIRIFTAFMNAVLPLADTLLTISRSSAADIERHAASAGIALRCTPVVLPIGTGFSDGKPGVALSAEPVPIAGPYVLAVSTIEARKNHTLLFHVWRRLLDEMPREDVPRLVLAGRTGWLVDDLMAQLRNCGFLDGWIVRVESATDAALARLYAGCMFTVFPSFYEGWGLPVSESLGFGCPCIASSATSVPEAGGTLARYFDPANTSEAYRVIRAAIERPAELAALRERIAREFRPVAWGVTAAATRAALGAAEGG